MVERPIVATASKHSPDFFQKGPRQPVGPKAGAPTEGQNKGSAQRDAIKALAAVTPKIVEHRGAAGTLAQAMPGDRKSTRLNSSHVAISYAVFCLKKKKKDKQKKERHRKGADVRGPRTHKRWRD